MEYNYEIYNKKLIAIIYVFGCKLKDFTHSIKIVTDHKNLKYFITIKQLFKRQVC